MGGLPVSTRVLFMKLDIRPMYNALLFTRTAPGAWTISQGENAVMKAATDQRGAIRFYRPTKTEPEPKAAKSLSSAKRIVAKILQDGPPPSAPLIQFRHSRGYNGAIERMRLVVVNALPPDERPGDPRIMVIRPENGKPVIESVPFEETNVWASFPFSRKARPIAETLLNGLFPHWEEYRGRLIKYRHTSE